MRLSKIKLAGFKTFVDSTTIELPSNLVGIVGPNGCGKSNTIDAVRWVMGESSAKHLRGGSMSDVIFSGSSTRKPVGQASVELVFDNSDGSLGGEYARYAEISTRRQVTREGQSQYFLNGSRCRRRDITDIFLGTGLGPRSYAIIEQGMISRLIEAKPEEMRVYLEEAAGISKYKDRRKETETRIRNTRENLDRLNDIREEIEKQIERLKRQSTMAEKYKVLKAQERRHRAELLALGWRDLQFKMTSQEKTLREWELKLEAVNAESSALEAKLEIDRERHFEANEHFNKAQGHFYKLGADISRSEQAIQHAREARQRQQQELEQVTLAWREASQHIEQDRERHLILKEALMRNEPEYQLLQEKQSQSALLLEVSEEKMAEWQLRWDTHNQQNNSLKQTAEVERTRIDQYQKQIVQHQQRRVRIETEAAQLNLGELDLVLEQALAAEMLASDELVQRQTTYDDIQNTVSQQRAAVKQSEASLTALRSTYQSLSAKHAALTAVQKAVLNQSSQVVTDWLDQQKLKSSPRLATQINVAPGWEKAADVVLSQSLNAILVDNLDSIIEATTLPSGDMTLLEPSPQQAVSNGEPCLLDKITNSGVDLPWLADVYVVETLADALQKRASLKRHESVVCREGFWLGQNYLRVSGKEEGEQGLLEREQTLNALSTEQSIAEQQLEESEARHTEITQLLQASEEQREQLQAALNTCHRESVNKASQAKDQQMRQDQAQQRKNQLSDELAELQEQIEQSSTDIEEGRLRYEEAIEQAEGVAEFGQQLQQEKAHFLAQLADGRLQEKHDREQHQKIAVQLEATRTELATIEQNMARMQSQLSHSSQQRESLEAVLNDADAPITEQTQALEALLNDRLSAEQALAATRELVETIGKNLRQSEQDRANEERKIADIRDKLGQEKLELQTSSVRASTFSEQISETDFSRDELLDGLNDSITVNECETRVSKMTARINQLGPINLAAIDEYKEQVERQSHIETQHQDILDALETLENAIAKIDKETKARFKETFDQVNARIQVLFPRLFGGGQASLELTGDNLLDTGVSIMARPPGKRVSHIQLLSGGEKALTAVAMVFAFFELNPAPFCMLDEVDAPLDDANVGRFCDLVRDMSKHVQFIFITHNKTTMELSNHLMGVTMSEPGTSRLVSVDVQEAAKMANA